MERNLDRAAQLAVDLAAEKDPSAAKDCPTLQPTQVLSPVIMSTQGQYESTRGNLALKEHARVLVMGTGKAVSSDTVDDLLILVCIS